MTLRSSDVGFHAPRLPWAIATESTVVARMSGAQGNADHRPIYRNAATSYASKLTRDGIKEPGG